MGLDVLAFSQVGVPGPRQGDWEGSAHSRGWGSGTR